MYRCFILTTSNLYAIIKIGTAYVPVEIIQIDRYSKYRSFSSMTTLSEKYGDKPLYKCGVDDEKIEAAVRNFITSDDKNVIKDAYFFLRAVYSSFRGEEIVHRIPAGDENMQIFQERAERFDSAFSQELTDPKLSELITKPA